MADYYQTCAIPKGLRRQTLKGRKDRAEAKVKRDVRAQCFERDGPCRIASILAARAGDVIQAELLKACSGYGEWAHLHAKRRSKTRGMAPEQRHDSAHSLMLCRVHHQEYDAHRLIITALTRKGADGPLKFRRAAK